MKRHMMALPLVAAVVLASPAIVDAQVCRGTAPFSAGHTQAGLGAAFMDGGDAITGELAFGRTQGAFGSVNVGAISYDGSSEKTMMVGGSAGLQRTIASQPRAQLCPTVSLALGFGPEIGDTELSQQIAVLGATFGRALGDSPSLQYIPTFGAGLGYQRVSISGGGFDDTDSETYAVVTAGFGFVFNQRWSVLPTLTIPLGLDGSEETFGASVHLSF